MNWLNNYYSRLLDEYKISMERKDRLFDWSIGILFVAIVAYSDLLANSSPSLWRIGLLVALSAFIMRMFGNSCLAYGYLRNWRYLLDRIESHWKSNSPTLTELEDDIQKYHHTKTMTKKCSYFVQSQLKVGFFILFIVPFTLIIFEVVSFNQDLGSLGLLVALGVYYYYEIILLKKIDKSETGKKVSTIKSWLPSIIAILLIASFIFGCIYGYNTGQIFVANHVRHNVEVVEHLSSSRVQTALMEYFPNKLNYTELFVWESTRINFTQHREVHTDPLEILEYKKGACGEFSILYVAACLANDIPARLVVTGYVIQGSVDHTWAEVNPSKDGKTWIHVEPTDCAYNILNGMDVSELTSCYNNPSKYYGKGIELILAFEPTSDGEVLIWDRTDYYSGGDVEK